MRMKAPQECAKLWMNFINMDFPGVPVLKTAPFQCGGHGFDPWSEKFHMPHGMIKNDF